MRLLKVNFCQLVLLLLMISCEQESLNPIDSGNVALKKSNALSSITYENSNWMTALDGTMRLTDISIPGTHDSGARFDHPLLSGTAKCQNLTIQQQLEAGVRYLDIRCRHIGNTFTIHHGVVYQNLNFDDVRNACFTFLQNNPDETIIMSIKEEHTPENNSRSFEATLEQYLQQNPGQWYLGESIPNLSQVRGKIVLLRRFSAANLPKGINATNWQDNTTFEINNTQAQLKVQDMYQVADNNAKWNAIHTLLQEASSGNANSLYLNHTSGYKPGIFGIPSIPTVSNNINPRIENFFSTQGQGRFGVVIMDFATSSLTEPIIATNFQ